MSMPLISSTSREHLAVRRGRMVRDGETSVETTMNGSVSIRAGHDKLELTEHQALQLHELMPLIVQWTDEADADAG